MLRLLAFCCCAGWCDKNCTNQLIETITQFSRTTVCRYDNYSNIRYESAVGVAFAYAYTALGWRWCVRNLCDSTTISYDAIGNPTSDGTWTYTWAKGRQLQKMTKSGETATFTYNADGLRVKKVCTTTGTTRYTLHGKNIVHLKTGGKNLHFFYDAQNRPAIVVYNGTAYGYVHNLQGDVIALVDSAGTKVVEYKYDAWGKPLSKTGSIASTLGTLNPFRYRSYVYDEESGLYYLRDRYYKPVCGRFVNADLILGNVGEVGSHNAYAYCKNSPISKCDPDGYTSLDAGYFFQQASTADGPLPYGDIIGLFGSLGILLFGALQQALSRTDSSARVREKERSRENEPTYIYRYGSSTFRNLTPRAIDEGLSFSLLPPPNGKAFRTTMEAVNASGLLIAVNDNGMHVSIMPVDPSTMDDWKSTRETANESPHMYTLLLFSLGQ